MKKVGVITMLANGLISITHGNMVVTMMVILWVSAIVSSFLDNIPFVATLIPMILTMQSEGMDVAPIWWALSRCLFRWKWNTDRCFCKRCFVWYQ